VPAKWRRIGQREVGGQMVIKPVRYSLDDFARLLPAPTGVVTLEYMDRAIASSSRTTGAGEGEERSGESFTVPRPS
jgi:hypothetical protein